MFRRRWRRVPHLELLRLKGVLAEAVLAFYAVLDKYTLADISRNREVLGKILMNRHENHHDPMAQENG